MTSMSSSYGLQRPSAGGYNIGGTYNSAGFNNFTAMPNYGHSGSIGNSSAYSHVGMPRTGSDVYKPSSKTTATSDMHDRYTPAYGKSGHASDSGRSGYKSDYKSKGSNSSFASSGYQSDHKSSGTSDYGLEGYLSDYGKRSFILESGRKNYFSSLPRYQYFNNKTYGRTGQQANPYVYKTNTWQDKPDSKEMNNSEKTGYPNSDFKHEEMTMTNNIKQFLPAMRTDLNLNNESTRSFNQSSLHFDPNRKGGKAIADFTSGSEITNSEEEEEEEEGIDDDDDDDEEEEEEDDDEAEEEEEDDEAEEIGEEEEKQKGGDEVKGKEEKQNEKENDEEEEEDEEEDDDEAEETGEEEQKQNGREDLKGKEEKRGQKKNDEEEDEEEEEEEKTEGEEEKETKTENDQENVKEDNNEKLRDEDVENGFDSVKEHSYLISRGTSPVKDVDEVKNSDISSPSKSEIPQKDPTVTRKHTGCQISYDDLQYNVENNKQGFYGLDYPPVNLGSYNNRSTLGRFPRPYISARTTNPVCIRSRKSDQNERSLDTELKEYKLGCDDEVRNTIAKTAAVDRSPSKPPLSPAKKIPTGESEHRLSKTCPLTEKDNSYNEKPSLGNLEVKKDYRKSVLNMNLDDKDIEEFKQKQADLRCTEKRSRRLGHRHTHNNRHDHKHLTRSLNSLTEPGLEVNMNFELRRSSSRSSLTRSSSRSRLSPEATSRRRTRKNADNSPRRSHSESSDLIDNKRSSSPDSSSSEEEAEVHTIRLRRRRNNSKDGFANNSLPQNRSQSFENGELDSSRTFTASQTPIKPSLLEEGGSHTSDTGTAFMNCSNQVSKSPTIVNTNSEYEGTIATPQISSEISCNVSKCTSDSSDEDSPTSYYGDSFTVHNTFRIIENESDKTKNEFPHTPKTKFLSGSICEPLVFSKKENCVKDSGFPKHTNTNNFATDLSPSPNEQNPTIRSLSKTNSEFMGHRTNIDSLLNENNVDTFQTFEDNESQPSECKKVIPITFQESPQKSLEHEQEENSDSEDETECQEENYVCTEEEDGIEKDPQKEAKSEGIDNTMQLKLHSDVRSDEKVARACGKENSQGTLDLFIGKFKNIDDVLGETFPISSNFGFPVGPVDDEGDDLFSPRFPEQTKVLTDQEYNEPGGEKQTSETEVVEENRKQKRKEEKAEEWEEEEEEEEVENTGEEDEEEEEGEEEKEDEGKEDEEEAKAEEEEDGFSAAPSSALEEVEPSSVLFHEAKTVQNAPVIESLAEESNLNSREIQDFGDTDHKLCTEIDSNEVKIRLPNIMKGELLKSPKVKLDDCSLQVYKYSESEADYGNYLDLEATIAEQAEEFEGFTENRKNALVLRTQLAVRVHTIIERLLNSNGRDLRRALFSLKQIFQDDKDLVHEFVQNDGLACLIKVGSEADQNYQNYILRALGQVMLYVDGMNGVIKHNETIQWLYSLIASKFRLVVKTALKLLLVFVEYTESNSLLILQAVNTVDSVKASKPWSNIMKLLNEKDSADMELLVYAVTLINKTLNAIPDQDTYYDITDWLEEQGMERVIQYYMSKQGTDLDLLQQFQIYEAVLRHEDGDDDGKPLPLDAHLRQFPRSRRPSLGISDRRKSRRHSVGSLPSPGLQSRPQLLMAKLPDTPEEPSNPPWVNNNKNIHNNNNNNNNNTINNNRDLNHNGPIFRKREPNRVMLHVNGTHTLPVDHNGITPALRRRRERDARNRSLMKEQEESKEVNYMTTNGHSAPNSPNALNEVSKISSPTERNGVTSPSIVGMQRLKFESHVEDLNRKNQHMNRICDSEQQRNNFGNENVSLNSSNSKLPVPLVKQNSRTDIPNKKSWVLDMMYGKKSQEETNSQTMISPPVEKNCGWTPTVVMKPRESEEIVIRPTQLIKEGSIKDMQEKFMLNRTPSSEGLKSPTVDNRSRLGDTTGIISRAKEGLAASHRTDVSRVPLPHQHSSSSLADTKKPENDLQWEQLLNSISRPLVINDLDFTDMGDSDDLSVLQSLGFKVSPPDTRTPVFGMGGAPPPPPPPSNCLGGPPPPPPIPGFGPPPPPPPPFILGAPPPPPQPFPVSQTNGYSSGSVVPPWVSNRLQQGRLPANVEQVKTITKGKKTVKLFWKEVKEDPMIPGLVKKSIWDEIRPVQVDTQKLEHLFESRAKDIMNKKNSESGKKQMIVVLDPKRSNAINIGMTKLPPPRTIKTAILKMDSTIMNREGIEKILSTMMPTEEEKTKIQEAQMSQPEVPLGSAELCLLTLSSISELEARLRLWAFRLDYDTMEREVAEPLMDLKQSVFELENNKTFRAILGTLRSIGNFLNGVEVKGFNIDYLAKVPEVKDTVHKHSLLHHLCHIVMEKFPNSSDLYSEIGAVTRASKVDFDEVCKNLSKMEMECKASWDYLKAVAKHDGSTSMKVRMSEFLADCAERIIVLGIIHRRVINRFHKLLVFLGMSLFSLREAKVQAVCKILSEFALEYRTTRERVLQQMEKKATHRERNKTRGKMITEMDKFRTKEQQADHELRQLLGNGTSDAEDSRFTKWGTMPGLKSRNKPQFGSNNTLSRLNGTGGLISREESMTDADDEVLESLVKTATAQPAKGEPRTRKKARYGDRKSLRRTLRSGLDLSDEDRLMLAAISS